MKILMHLHVMRDPEYESYIFSVWSLCVSVCACVCVCVCARVCVCVYVSVISIIQKQIAAEASNLVFHTRIMYIFYMKLCINIRQKLCVQGYTKEF